jgi:hypothetical protein
VKFVAGKNATGTVWADAFTFNDITPPGSPGWGGQDWNTSVGVPTGWYYWLPPIGGNDGVLANGFENTVVTTEAAHSGTHSLKFDLPFDRVPHDGFVATRWAPLNGTNTATMLPKMPRDVFNPNDVQPGDWLRLSVWIKASNLVPDSAAKDPGSWAVGFTPGFFSGTDNNQGYNPIFQHDYVFAFPPVTSFDWTQYSLDVQVPNDTATHAIEVRLHVYNRFTGTIYFDDLTVTTGTATGVVDGKNGVIPQAFELANNYPNPFNPSTVILYGLPNQSDVRLEIFNLLGQHVRTLVEGNISAGYHQAVWDGRDDKGQTLSPVFTFIVCKEVRQAL